MKEKSITPYSCAQCQWKGSSEDAVLIDDVESRVSPGELMAAGQCPNCGALIAVADADVPDYTLEAVAQIMRARGWTVSAPRQKHPRSCRQRVSA